MCVRTVPSEMLSLRPICVLVAPSAMSRSSSQCRGSGRERRGGAVQHSGAARTAAEALLGAQGVR
jgi:hypothetical protein